MKNSNNTIQTIKKKLLSILDAIIRYGYYREVPLADGYHYLFVEAKSTEKFRECETATLVPFSQEDKRQLVNLATAIYLDEWLENDMNARQTIHGFSIQPFRALDEKKSGGDSDITHARRSGLVAAERKYDDMMRLQKEQSQREGFRRKEEEGPLRKKDNKLYDIENESPNGGKWKDFPTLCILDWIAEGNFGFYDLLVYRKKMLTVAGERDTNDPLRKAYKSYLCKISKLKNEPDNKIYTISAITLQKIETDFLHTLAPALAFSVEISPSITMHTAIEKTYPFLGRYLYRSQFFDKALREQYLHPIGISDEKWLRPMHDMNRDVHLFRDLIHLIPEDNPLLYFQAMNNLLVKRGLLLDMLRLINASDGFSPKQMPPWTSDDYSSAAEFFKKDYPVIEQHILFDFLPPDKWPNSVYDNIRHFFESIPNDELVLLRKEAQQSQKTRNKKKSKS